MKVTFGRTQRLYGDMEVTIFIDGAEAGTMCKDPSAEYAEWYVHGDTHTHLYDEDLGPTLREAKQAVRQTVLDHKRELRGGE